MASDPMSPEVLVSVPDEMEAAAIRGLQATAYWLEGEAVGQLMETKPYATDDTGELARSAKTTKLRKGAVVSFDAPHAPFMEYGTRPHFPPIAPLADWAIRKGMADTQEEADEVALAVARKIAKHGIEPRHFLAKAVAEMKRRRIVSRMIKDELKDMPK